MLWWFEDSLQWHPSTSQVSSQPAEREGTTPLRRHKRTVARQTGRRLQDMPSASPAKSHYTGPPSPHTPLFGAKQTPCGWREIGNIGVTRRVRILDRLRPSSGRAPARSGHGRRATFKAPPQPKFSSNLRVLTRPETWISR